ncbi:MAG: hypothetical protein DRJ38_03630 [Thermoprotei archaeon]|nr:MAG: hypothetical protein DRJ38_03630 [Thermoprotei archaeon]
MKLFLVVVTACRNVRVVVSAGGSGSGTNFDKDYVADECVPIAIASHDKLRDVLKEIGFDDDTVDSIVESFEEHQYAEFQRGPITYIVHELIINI